MLRQKLAAFRASLGDIYGLKDDHAKGRLISLGDSLVTSFYNVFITGIFYTGFLSMYGISITGVGVISFIPYIASCLSVFSSAVLERIQRRKPWLIASKVLFYLLYIIATTLMPQFVTGEQQRLTWFIIILFVAYGEYALFSPGFTPWFYRFYPEDNERRSRYISLNQIFSSVMSSVVLLASGLITDAVSGSPFQTQLILGLRYFAFFLVIVDVAMQACAKEYPYSQGEKIRFSQVFTLPFKYRKFLYCILLMFFWNFIANLNNGLWGYHLLNHMDFSYTLINAMSIMYTVILIFTTPLWRKVLRRYSWIKTFGISCLLFLPTEFCFFFMTKESTWMYVPLSFWQNVTSVGMNLSYSNILYMHLPSENSTAHIAFYSIGVNLFAFLGLMTGTWVSSITGDTPMLLWGISVYSIQFTTVMRGVTIFAVAMFCIFKWRLLTKDSEIAEIDAFEAKAAQQRAYRRRMRKGARG